MLILIDDVKPMVIRQYVDAYNCVYTIQMVYNNTRDDAELLYQLLLTNEYLIIPAKKGFSLSADVDEIVAYTAEVLVEKLSAYTDTYYVVVSARKILTAGSAERYVVYLYNVDTAEMIPDKKAELNNAIRRHTLDNILKEI